MKKATSIGISCVAIQKNNYYDFICYFAVFIKISYGLWLSGMERD